MIQAPREQHHEGYIAAAILILPSVAYWLWAKVRKPKGNKP